MRKQRQREGAFPPVAVVGLGRLGTAIAVRLQSAAVPIVVLPRSPESVRRAVAHRLKLADHDDLAKARLCLLAVSDSAIATAADLVEADLGPQTPMVHLSGAHALTVFGAPRGRPLGSFHPLVAISDGADRLSGHAVAIAATTPRLLKTLEQLAAILELSPIRVPDTGRAAYHAGAVLCAGLLTALLDAGVAALRTAGLPQDQAIAALLPLMRSALRGVSVRGLSSGLTGPVVRGDVSVVQAHLEALSPDVGAIYRLLSQRALDLATALPQETRSALSRILQ